MIPQKNLHGKKCWRIIPSRYPPIGLFDRVTDPEDLEAIIELESMTNDRLRNEAGNLSLVTPEDRVSGPNTSYIMAAFTHLNPRGSRFSDGTWGVYYASLTLDTSIAETKYHREQFLSFTNEAPIHIDMRVITAKATADLEDISTPEYLGHELYHPHSYRDSQAFARTLKTQGSEGIFYQSVRDQQGYNIAAFKPRTLTACQQEQHLEYVWDGSSISSIFEKKLYKGKPSR